MKVMRIFLLLIAITLFSFQGTKRSCNPKDNIDIDSIIAYKINSNFTTPISIKCITLRDDEDAKRIDLIGYKQRIVNNLSESKLTVEKWQVDARALIEIWHRSGKVDRLGIGNLMYLSFNDEIFILPNRDIAYLLDSLYMDILKKEWKNNKK